MKQALVTFCLFAVCSLLQANETVFKIEIGKDYKSYSNRDLQRRVWELERAVMQLQSRVFDLEKNKKSRRKKSKKEWICTVSPFTDRYTGIGATKAEATHKAIKACTKAGQSSMFCKNAKCEN